MLRIKLDLLLCLWLAVHVFYGGRMYETARKDVYDSDEPLISSLRIIGLTLLYMVIGPGYECLVTTYEAFKWLRHAFELRALWLLLTTVRFDTMRDKEVRRLRRVRWDYRRRSKHVIENSNFPRWVYGCKWRIVHFLLWQDGYK